MKVIDYNGSRHAMYKPNEVAEHTGYHPRTIRRLINAGRIYAVNSNPSGKQPVWWVPKTELVRLKKEFIKATKVKKK